MKIMQRGDAETQRKKILAAARELEAKQAGSWTAVTLYLQMFPGTGYRTKESGVSRDVQALIRTGAVKRVAWGLRLNPSPSASPRLCV